MRSFLILSLVAVAYGRPDVSHLGYTYNVGQSNQQSGSFGPSNHHNSIGHIGTFGFNNNANNAAFPAHQEVNRNNFGHIGSIGASSNANNAVLAAPNQVNHNNFGHTASPSSSFNVNPSVQVNHNNFGHTASPSSSFNVNPSVQRGSNDEPLVRKQFYVHSAPEDNEVQHKHFVLGRPQKNYRVVFIKAPTTPTVKLSAEYAPTEEKTHIFVLSKKEPELDVNDIATPAPTEPSKPEVFFIKYRTPEEAIHAQQKIQEQYDQVGGTSQFSNEGISPVSSVIGAFDNDKELAPSSSNQDGVRARQYLPPQSR